ncbi:hypothetical protein FRC98_18425 [Lujinxingia vulgaris]|uniref:Uncharacterized protein n=1 Tax=Lujinxingia vulgaris TaxID=2600176 RepID=A0A5C6X8R4_9DELT|nr:M66 family metalloprotease [Lujinxingia vulgaris]TXD34390.1 hypothetical protein FRC98_18425 [Lujinxingia vulgaris]
MTAPSPSLARSASTFARAKIGALVLALLLAGCGQDVAPVSEDLRDRPDLPDASGDAGDARDADRPDTPGSPDSDEVSDIGEDPMDGGDSQLPDAGEPDTDEPDAEVLEDADADPVDVGEDPDPAELSLQIDRVEIFQTIAKTPWLDGAANFDPTPIIAGRDTLLRASVDVPTGWSVSSVRAELIVVGAGGAQTLLEDTRVVSADSLPGDRSSAFEFELPGGEIEVGGQLRLRLIEDAPNGELLARWPTDGSAWPTGATAESGELHLVLVPMRFDTDGSGRLPDTSPGQLALIESALRALYPLHSLRLEVREPYSWSGSVRWGNFTQALRDLKIADGEDEAYYYGLIQPAETFEAYCGGSCTTGQSYTVSSATAYTYRVGAGLGYAGERWVGTLIHELGHMHGRGHAPCGVSWWSDDNNYPHAGGDVGVWGWDRRSDALIAPDDAADFMGYCSPSWISDYTYRGLFDRMSAVREAASNQRALPPGVYTPLSWSRSEEAALGAPRFEANPTTGEVAQVRFLNEAGEVVGSMPAPLVRFSHEDRFEVLLTRFPEDARRVQVEVEGQVREVELR